MGSLLGKIFRGGWSTETKYLPSSLVSYQDVFGQLSKPWSVQIEYAQHYGMDVSNRWDGMIASFGDLEDQLKSIRSDAMTFNYAGRLQSNGDARRVNFQTCGPSSTTPYIGITITEQ